MGLGCSGTRNASRPEHPRGRPVLRQAQDGGSWLVGREDVDDPEAGELSLLEERSLVLDTVEDVRTGAGLARATGRGLVVVLPEQSVATSDRAVVPIGAHPREHQGDLLDAVHRLALVVERVRDEEEAPVAVDAVGPQAEQSRQLVERGTVAVPGEDHLGRGGRVVARGGTRLSSRRRKAEIRVVGADVAGHKSRKGEEGDADYGTHEFSVPQGRGNSRMVDSTKTSILPLKSVH